MYRVSIGRLGQTVEQVSTALWIPGIQDNDLTDSIPVGIPRLLSEFVRVCTDECGVQYLGGLIGRPPGILTPRKKPALG